MKKLKNRFLHNFKDYKRIACILLCAVMSLMLIGCCAKAEAAEQIAPLDIFWQNTKGAYHTLVVVDSETGVNYVVVSTERGNGEYSIAITPRLNADGTPYTGESNA